MKIWVLSIMACLAITMSGCKDKASQKANAPGANGAVYNEYLYAFPSGVMKKDDRWLIVFSKPIFDSSELNKTKSIKAISFNPSLEGFWKCVGPSSLEFIPEISDIKTQQTYQYTLDLKAFFPNVKEEFRYVVESFEYKPTMLNVEWGIPRYDASKPKFMKMEALGKFSDAHFNLKIFEQNAWIENEDGKKMQLQAVRVDSSSNEIKLICYDLERMDKGQQITVKYPSSLDNPKQQISHSFYLPGKDEFVVMGCDDKTLRAGRLGVYFSDPLPDTIDARPWLEVNPSKNTYTLEHKTDELWIQFDPDQIPAQGDIKIKSNLPSIHNTVLLSPYQYFFTTEEKKPQVRFLSDGNILPYDDKIILPFEAINLHTLDLEIFKIFSNNVLYSLHLNLGEYESYYMSKLGRVVHQQKIDLRDSDNRQTWKRYSLDLSKMIQPEPGAFYEVRLVFRPEYSNYHCAKELKLNFKYALSESGSEDFTSVWNQWSPGYMYESDDSYEYNYNEQDPCSASYYYSNNYARRTVLASNIAMTVKYAKGNKNAFVLVSDIQSALPVKSASIEWFDQQLQSMGKMNTGSDGICYPVFSREPSIIVAKKNNNYAYIKLDESGSRPVSEFDVEGVQIKEGIKAALYSERGVYRPGDTIFFQTVLHQLGTKLPASFPLRLKVFNPRRQLVYDQTLTRHLLGLFSFEVPTHRNDLTGAYRFVVSCGINEFNKTILVETIKPNRFKVQHDLTQDLKLFDIKSSEKNVQVNWMHGAPANKKELDITLRYSIHQPPFKKMRDFNFIYPEGREQGEFSMFKAATDEKGKAKIDLEILNTLPKTGIAKANWVTQVMDAGGEISTDYFSQNIWKNKVFIGARIKGNNSRYQLNNLDGDQLDIIAVDDNENALSDRKVKVELFEVFGEWWYEIRNNNSAGFEYGNYRRAISIDDVITNAKGMATVSFKLQKYKQYFVRITDAESGYMTGEYFSTGWYYGDDEQTRQFASVLSFKSDKESYTVGEKINIALPQANNGYFNVSIIRGNNVIQHFQVKAEESRRNFEFTATAEMSPNAYVDISLVQGKEKNTSDLPLRMYGVIPIAVENPESRLQASIQTVEEVKPQQDFEILVSEKNNREMAYHLYIVDEGILSLTRFITPDPYKDIFAKEGLSMLTWDNFSDIIGHLDAATERIISIGGDAGGSDKFEPKNQRFKPVVLRSGQQYLKKGEKKIHRFSINNFVGEVRVMLIANNMEAYGATEKAIKVKQDLMCQLTLPRVINIGDEMSLPVNIFTGNDKIKNVNINITTNGPIKLLDSPSSNVNFEKAGEKLALYKLKTTGLIGNGSVKVKVESNGLSYEDRIEFYVDNPNPITHQTKEIYLDPNKSINGKVPLYGTAGSRSVLLTFSSIPDLNYNRLCQELLTYPHGCLEQTVSAAFPQLYLPSMADLTAEDAANAQTNVQQALIKLQKFQHNDGRLSYWPGSDGYYEWTNAYAFHFMTEAKNLGYRVSDALYANLQKNLRRTTLEYKEKITGKEHWANLNQAYRLYLLSLSGNPEWSMMNRMQSFPKNDIMSKWLLAGAFAVAGKKEYSQRLIAGQTYDVSDYQEMSYTFGSGLRDESIICMMLMHMDNKEDAFKQLVKILKKFKNSNYYNTQEAAFVLAASHKVISQWQLQKNITIDLSWNGKKQTISSNKPFISIRMDGNEIPDYYFNNKSNRPVYASITQFGKTDLQNSTAASSGMTLQLNYYGSSAQKLHTFRQGDRIKMECQIKNDKNISDYDNSALTIPIPAGFEIVNHRIGGLQQNGPSRYTDIRDDRLYTYFNLLRGGNETIELELIAAYPGVYMQPEVFVEAMYDPAIYARTKAMKVEILPLK